MKTKILTIAIICFSVMNMQSIFSQDKKPFEMTQEYSAPPPTSQSPSSSNTTLDGPLRGNWGGGDSPDPNNPTTGGEAPIGSGLWILTGLVVAYGIVRRNSMEKKIK